MSESYGRDEAQDLEKSLRMLGLRDIEERLEVSPLGPGTGPLGAETADPMVQSCQRPLPLCRLVPPDDPVLPTSTGPTAPGSES